MPKIVIKEYDQTKPGFVASNNFSVVVPGFVADGKGVDEQGNSVFDENGIYVCDSKADFENYIGKVASAGAAIEPIAPVTTTDEAITLTAEEFYLTYKDQVYQRSEAETEADQYVGRLHSYDATNQQYYVFTQITSDWNVSSTYFVILKGNEGVDGSEGNFQYGNQIADFLLGLGYQVLYVKLDTMANLAEENTFEALKDRSVYDFRYLISGLVDNCGGASVDAVNGILNAVANHINSNTTDANGRGDCIALLDIAKSVYTDANTGTVMSSSAAVEAIKGAASGGSTYSAFFAPVVYYGGVDDEAYENNNEFPASVHYLACAAAVANRYPEWFAISGYTRGTSSVRVIGTGVKLGDAAVNALQPRSGSGPSVNLVINLNGNYYLWGNRTAQALSSELVASHFLNIRQLCSTLKKAIYSACRTLMFDPNSDVLWLNFCNAIRPVLERMKANQGIKDYRFEKKETSLKAKLFAAVRIVPIEAVEDFEIGITLEDEIGEASISIDEYLAG